MWLVCKSSLIHLPIQCTHTQITPLYTCTHTHTHTHTLMQYIYTHVARHGSCGKGVSQLHNVSFRNPSVAGGQAQSEKNSLCMSMVSPKIFIPPLFVVLEKAWVRKAKELAGKMTDDEIEVLCRYWKREWDWLCWETFISKRVDWEAMIGNNLKLYLTDNNVWVCRHQVSLACRS